MVDIVCRIPEGKKTTVLAWLLSKGIDVNRDSDGVVLTEAENIIGDTCTPIMKDVVTGDMYLTIRLYDNIAAKIPDKPDYILWRSDSGEVNTVTVTVDDGDGGTRQQAVTKIA